MPLILLTGYPCAGLTHRATQLQTLLSEKITSLSTTPPSPSRTQPSPAPAQKSKLRIHTTTSHTLHRRTAYADVKRAEKDARAALFSEVKRELGKDVILIVDALNYIKGYRYQMWCFAKEMETPMCVVHVGTPIEQCKLVNARRLKGGKEETGGVERAGEDNEEAYEPEVFENLIYRYEEPNGMNRWDSPLFTVLWGDGEPPVQNIWDALVGSEGRGRVVRSHQATVLAPPSDPSHLHALDLTTQRIITHILSTQRDNPTVTEIPIPETIIAASEEGEKVVELGSGGAVMLPQLQRLRRQFISMNRRHDVKVERAGVLFVEFLNGSLRG